MASLTEAASFLSTVGDDVANQILAANDIALPTKSSAALINALQKLPSQRLKVAEIVARGGVAEGAERARGARQVQVGNAATRNAIRLKKAESAIKGREAARVTAGEQTGKLINQLKSAGKTTIEGVGRGFRTGDVNGILSQLESLGPEGQTAASELRIDAASAEQARREAGRAAIRESKVAQVDNLLKGQGVTRESKLGGTLGFGGQTVDDALAGVKAAQGRVQAGSPAVKEIAGRAAAQSRTRGNVLKGGAGALIVSLLASKLLGKEESPSLPPELQMALSQQLAGAQGGEGGGGVNTSRTLMDVSRLLNIIKTIQGVQGVSSATQPRGVI